MSDGRDPAIKLFGRKIPLLEEQTPMEEGDVADSAPAMEPLSEEEKDTCGRKATIEAAKSMPGAPAEPDPKQPPPAPNNSTELPKETSTDTAKAADKPQPEQDHKEAADAISGQDKLLKKPDKVLPCPRCNSMDTKFCYFNNYNVNQPRHFCKNCQRYWTAGGSMRNVPVGAGRRKNKHAASTYRHTMIAPEALASVHGDSPDSIDPKPPSPFNGNGTLLKFGPDAPLCESMAAMLNLGEENREEASSSSPCKPEENGFPENTEQNSMNSSSNGNTPLPHLQFFPGPLWGCYPWHPGWSNAAAAMAAAGCSAQTAAGQDLSWNQPPLLASAFCSPYPIPFLPPFWGWGGGQPWTVASSPSSPTTTGHCSGNVSPTLGKHSREEKTEKSLWIPKTLRIDDPDEAAKSSIFATLGIKLDRAGKFRAFSSRSGNGEEEASNAAQVRRANPAAMSRSQSFQEITL